MNHNHKIALFFLLVVAGVGLRLVFRDVPNFAPVAAMALFSGFLFGNAWLAALVPISVLTLTNLFLGGYESWIVMVSVYACLVLPVLLGQRMLRQNRTAVSQAGSVLGLTLFGSLLFFFVTNYASWLYWYPKTVAGFIECYVNAIPFFRYTLMGDLFFCFVFFGAHAFVVGRIESTRSVVALR